MTTLRETIIPGSMGILLVLCGAVIAANGVNEETVRTLIRVTAGSSLLLFSLAWSASSVNSLLSSERWRPVVQARRRTGIAFALSHTAHLLAIIWLVELAFDGDWTDFDLVGGGVIYALIYAMAFTSNDRAVRALGARRWNWLHWIGGYAIWVGFASSYVGNALSDGAPYDWTCSLIAIAILLLRVAAFWKGKRST
jgi:DMSO/TMAO reductase YedYZ heme-binding membrane subunit